MRDLSLWRALSRETLDVESLLPQLEALAHIPLAQRFPFFGALDRALEHPDVRLRAAAIRALSGAEGPLAWPRLVSALDDRSVDVRLAAVEALRVSATSQPARFAHALFHPDPDVRRAAVSGTPPPGTEAWSFYLLADTACAEIVRERVTLPPGALPAVLELAHRGVVSEDEARRWISEMPWQATASWLAGAHRRSPEECAAVIASEGADARGADALDDLFALFFRGPGDAVRRGTFRKISDALKTNHALRPRVLASLLAAVRAKGPLPEALALCAVLHPASLGFRWIPRDARHGALAGLYDFDAHCPRIPDEEARALLDLDVCRRPHGALDLWAVGAILRLVVKEPYTTLLGWFSEEEIVDAFVSDMERAAPFLSLHDNSKKGRAHLLGCIAKSAPGRRAEVLALLCETVAANELDFLDPLDATEATAVASAILVRQVRPDVRLAANKVERIAHILGTTVAGADPSAFLRDWLGHATPESLSLGLSMLGVIGRELSIDRFVEVCTALDTFLLKRLVSALPYAPKITYGMEVALAHALIGHVSPTVHDWARARVPEHGEAEAPPSRRVGTVALGPALAHAIAAADEVDLPDALEPCLRGPTVGLTAALRDRKSPSHPCLAACVALLGSHDDPVEVAIELERFGSKGAAFMTTLETAAVRTWLGALELPLVGHAWLHRFESHAFAAVADMLTRRGGIPGQLAGALMLRSEVLCLEIWRATARVLGIWRWRDRERLAEVATEGLVELLATHLDTSVGEPAASALVALFQARVAPDLLESVRPAVRSALPDYTDAVRAVLEPFVDARGLPSRTEPTRPRARPDEELLARIRVCDDLDELTRWCTDTDERIVHEAALRLILRGDEGTDALAALLAVRPLPPCFRALCDSIPLWSEGKPIDALRSMIARGIDVPELAHHVAVSLVERGEPHWLSQACEALCAEGETGWFRPRDWERLERLAADRIALYRAVATSPHPHAYRPAVERLLERTPDEGTCDAVRAFLDAGTDRIGELRRRAGWWLHRASDHHALPILVTDAFHDGSSGTALLAGASRAEVATVASSALCAGDATASESRLLELVSAADAHAQAEALELLLTECATAGVRQQVASRARSLFSRARKLRALAKLFAWGTRIGRELSGRVFRFHMIGGKGLGYTRLNANDVFVSPLPLLRGDRHGQEIVEALVLHEIGHHLHHRGEEEAKVWARAQEEGIGGLLNLVADEHLERNLRALDAAFGDRLKRLAAYAFQHADKEIPVTRLFDMLQGRTFDVLTATTLGVARAPDSIRVDNGTLLLEMEKSGLRFARFVRALRMGLGNRFDDPLIERGLALFDKHFRKGDMQSLLDVSHRLRELFGWEVSICETFGGHETVVGDGAESTIHGEGITDDEVQREVERVLDPRQARAQGGGAGGRGGRLVLNVNPDEAFNPITEVVKVPHDPERHRPVAHQVARHARQMRRYLERLGLSLVPARMRLSGRRFDPTRTSAVVLRGDPRMLIARETRVTTDLFIGVIVDCSGSMYGNNMEKARAFGVLLAEAARGLPGVDVRLFGFTDRVIYDAGDARYPAVASLEAGGGNNDAAALAHVAMVARRSKRRARLLVMISDGLPTECSVAALKGLVRTLSRREKMCCAQVAVRPIEEVCFPHYVELTEDELDPAVRRFGSIVMTLVRKAMST